MEQSTKNTLVVGGSAIAGGWGGSWAVTRLATNLGLHLGPWGAIAGAVIGALAGAALSRQILGNPDPTAEIEPDEV